MAKTATQIRLSEGTHRALRAIARRENRSFNGQMEYVLDRWIEQYVKEYEQSGGRFEELIDYEE